MQKYHSEDYRGVGAGIVRAMQVISTSDMIPTVDPVAMAQITGDDNDLPAFSTEEAIQLMTEPHLDSAEYKITKSRADQLDDAARWIRIWITACETRLDFDKSDALGLMWARGYPRTMTWFPTYLAKMDLYDELSILMRNKMYLDQIDGRWVLSDSARRVADAERMLYTIVTGHGACAYTPENLETKADTLRQMDSETRPQGDRSVHEMTHAEYLDHSTEADRIRELADWITSWQTVIYESYGLDADDAMDLFWAARLYQDAYFGLRDLLEIDVIDLLHDLHSNRHLILNSDNPDPDRPKGGRYMVSPYTKQMADEERKAWTTATHKPDTWFTPESLLSRAQALKSTND